MPGGPGGPRGLYRRLLRLHRALPPALRELGDRYVREEFRRHRAVGPAEAQRFLREWEFTMAELSGIEDTVGRSGWKMAGSAVMPGVVSEVRGTNEVHQNYAALIRQQINEDKQNSREKTVFGIQLTEEKLNDFRDEQIGQLKELMDEATKPHKETTVSKDSEHKS